MDIVAELAKVGVVGIFAYIMYKLYLDEKKAHDITRAALVQAILDRLSDSKESTASLTATSKSMADSVTNLTNKIELGKERS